MNTLTFAQEYQPERFEEIHGQEHPVKLLSGLIKRGQIGRNLLLHGAYGSGKTSLAHLYAKALNCISPTSSGSPCGACRWCVEENPHEAGLHEHDVSGTGGDRETIRDFLMRYDRSPLESGPNYSVLFFDEAHNLEPAAAESLLKSVQRPKPGVVYLFATTNYREILRPLRSRLIQLEIRPLSPIQSISFLQKIAHQKNLQYEPSALALLAGVKEGHPRDLLTGLEQVYETGPVTTALVREMFDVDQTEVIVAYFRALAAGDSARQTEIISSWIDPGPDKIKFITAFLLALYYNNILGQPLVVDPLVDSIQIERAEILESFVGRLGVANTPDLAPYWLKMIEFWAQSGAAEDEIASFVRLSLFHSLVNTELDLVAVGGTQAPRRNGPGSPEAVSTPPSGSPAVCGPWESTSDFVEADDVRSIVNRSSYLVQEHGVLFNAAFQFRLALFGISSAPDARRLVEKFTADLAGLADTMSDGETATFASLSLLEQDENGQLRLRVVAHLPQGRDSEHDAPQWRGRIFDWARLWHKEGRALSGEISVELARPDLSDWTFHWNKTIDLCAGLSEDIEARHPLRSEPEPILSLLKAPKTGWRAPAHFAGGRLLASPLLSSAALAEAAQSGMAPLSALDERAWDWVRKGWELKEFRRRREWRREYERRRAEIFQTHGRDTPDGNSELKRLDAWRRLYSRRAPWSSDSYQAAPLL